MKVSREAHRIRSSSSLKGPEMLSSPISHPVTNDHACETLTISI